MELSKRNLSYKIDGAGRMVIPASLRKEFDLNPGDKVEYFTFKLDGENYVAFKKIAAEE